MEHKKKLYFLFSAGGMLALILDGQTALLGAAEGVELCIRVVIPSLFPFLFLSTLLTGALWGNGSKFLVPAGRLMGIPAGAESLLIAGFLGGYPAGAKVLGQAHREGGLDTPTAERLLSFCSNAGPAFLFGMIASQFPQRKTVWALWGIHILSAVLVSLVIKPGVSDTARLSGMDTTPIDALTGAVKTMSILCGWILCFRILLSFLDRWFLWMLPEPVRVLIWGLLELSNGCCALTQVESESLRFVICSLLLAFGGLCVAMQTASVTEGIPMGAYLYGKLLQAGFALILSVIYLRFGMIGVLFLPAALILLLSAKKRSRFPGYSGV